MEITGKIIAVLPVQEGVSARTGSAWKSQDFVIETHEQYPRRCCFRVFGSDRLAAMNIQSGEELTVSFDIDSHEYNGRWYNDIRAWKVERVNATTAQAMGAYQPVAGPAPAPFPPQAGAAGMATQAQPVNQFPSAQDSTDDLPF